MRLPSRSGAACYKSDGAAKTYRNLQDGSYRSLCSATARNTVRFIIGKPRFGCEPPRKSARELRDQEEEAECSAVVPSLFFIVLLGSEFGLGSRPAPPHLPIRTHHMEDSGRSL